MLKAYKFVETDHQKLHSFVLAFFNRIEFETGEFSIDFFDPEFKKIVNRHWKILKAAFEGIYNQLKQWTQVDRSKFCLDLRQSNDIEQICSRGVIPKKFSDADAAIYKQIKELFIDLYTSVLGGKIIYDVWGVVLREHFDAFRKANNNITLCPMCGISELKTEYDKSRDQYDHYLPKAIYPLSSINFYNLIPICRDCNSLDIKGEKDILEITTDRLFYPYDQNHKGIEIKFSILKDDPDIAKIEWSVSFESLYGKNQEVDAWKLIFSIEQRYIGFVKGRIEKWYRAYWGYHQKPDLGGLTFEQKDQAYFATLSANEDECLDVIKYPAFSTFLTSSSMARAQLQALQYSL
jgi:hypothetical protein